MRPTKHYTYIQTYPSRDPLRSPGELADGSWNAVINQYIKDIHTLNTAGPKGKGKGQGQGHWDKKTKKWVPAKAQAEGGE